MGASVRNRGNGRIVSQYLKGLGGLDLIGARFQKSPDDFCAFFCKPDFGVIYDICQRLLVLFWGHVLYKNPSPIRTIPIVLVQLVVENQMGSSNIVALVALINLIGVNKKALIFVRGYRLLCANLGFHAGQTNRYSEFFRSPGNICGAQGLVRC